MSDIRVVPVRRKLLRPPARYAWMRPSAHRLGKHLTRSEPADGNSEARNSGIHRILAQARSADEGASGLAKLFAVEIQARRLDWLDWLDG